MIKFFRKIRQKLLTDLPASKAENKFSKYLLYAIGEIVLVVIGILIALQINNWNEDRLEEKEETKLLENLKLDFKQTIIEFNEMNSNRQTILSANYELTKLNSNDEF